MEIKREYCISKVEVSWPLAYADCEKRIFIPLENHLLRSANNLLKLFKDEILIFEDTVQRSHDISINLLEIAYTAALIHDLGKVSKYYIEKFIKEQQRQSISFYLHEFVIATLLEYISYLSQDELFKLSTSIVARIIARHHSAMKARASFENVSRDIKVIREALSKFKLLNKDIVKTLTSSELCKDYCKEVIHNIKRESSDIEEKVRKISLDMYLGSLRILGDDRYKSLNYKIITALSGFLIVADCITASEERRITDDGYSPLFVEDWIRELKYKFDKNEVVQ